MDLAFFAAQDALHALVQQVHPGVTVTLGTPGNVEPEHIWISGETPAAISRNYRQSGIVAADERFDLMIHILTERADPEYREVRDRIKALADPITAALADDPRLGGLLMLCVVVQAQPEETFKDDITRQMMLTLTVRCDAHVIKTG